MSDGVVCCNCRSGTLAASQHKLGNGRTLWTCVLYKKKGDCGFRHIAGRGDVDESPAIKLEELMGQIQVAKEELRKEGEQMESLRKKLDVLLLNVTTYIKKH